tara:strand:+ start:10791 stop:11150 length:360 start_codon:yes stop_codon:yes gene_type:complete
MAVLNKEYNKFDKEIKLNKSRKDSLKKSRKELKKKIQKWFRDNKPDEIKPKFHPQGSSEMGTTVNPLVTYDEEGKPLLDYDTDYGVYFIKKVMMTLNNRLILGTIGYIKQPRTIQERTQ